MPCIRKRSRCPIELGADGPRCHRHAGHRVPCCSRWEPVPELPRHIQRYVWEQWGETRFVVLSWNETREGGT